MIQPTKLARRKSSSARRKSDGEKASSRPSSRTSRRRADSAATVGVDEKEEKEKEKEKEKDKDKSSVRMSVAGWASSAIDSMMSGRGKKDKENFATLEEEEIGAHSEEKTSSTRPQLLRRQSSKSQSQPGSKRNTPSSSPSTAFRTLKSFTTGPSSGSPRMVRAINDFSGSVDELSFKSGDEIVLLNEVIEGWWMGELRGKKGLFPTSHTEPMHISPSTKLQRIPSWKRGGQISDEDMSKATLVNQDESDVHSNLMTSDDDDHPFSDSNHLSTRGAISPSYPSSYAGHNHRDSTTEDENDNNPLLKNDSHDDIHPNELPTLVRQPSFGKKPPPPPPPPRRTQFSGLAPPPIPQRNRTSSSLSSLVSTPADSSPFDSPMRSTFSVNDISTSANPFDRK